jgi:hypothetical protein
MSNKDVGKLVAERKRLLDEMGSLARILHGSWVERYSVCSRPDCKCHGGEKHGPRYYLVVNEDGRQRQKYIPKSQVPAALEGVEQHRRMQEIAKRITEINLMLIKERKYAED